MNAKLYGQTDTEHRFDDAKKCRDIVHEIVKFGVTQEQIARIVYLLALELEDREAMLAISDRARRLWDPLDGTPAERPGLIR